jgi:hypothetical protein
VVDDVDNTVPPREIASPKVARGIPISAKTTEVVRT